MANETQSNNSNSVSVNGITFDGKHSYTDFGMWIAKQRPDKGSPQPKLSTVNVPGADGILDLTKANTGTVKFGNRTMVLTFVKDVASADQPAFEASVMAALHGKRIEQIVFDDDPNWAFSGRATVRFTDRKSWKEKIIVTVDAAPYAMKLTEKTASLMGGQASLQSVVFDAVRGSTTYAWNTGFLFGTINNPSGLILPSNAEPYLIVKWPQNAPLNPNYSTASDYKVQVKGRYGGFYANAATHTHTLTSAEFSAREVRIALSDITQDSSFVMHNVTLNDVYDVFVNGIGNATLYIEVQSKQFTVTNGGRKSVIPTITMVASQTVATDIVVNGKTFTISSDNGIYYDISLNEGDNIINVPATAYTNLTDFYMTFREGKL